MKLSLKIAIVEPSVMVRIGLGTLLRKLSGMRLYELGQSGGEKVPEMWGL